MEISVAEIKDINELEALINNAYRGEHSKKGWTTEAYLLEGKRINAEGLQKIIVEPDSVILKYCNDKNELEGCVYLKKNQDKMYLGMLTVSPELQGVGIGKKIMKAAEEYALQNKCKAIEMRVISVRHELIAWYKKHGYNATGQILPFENEPALSVQTQPLQFIIMEKILL